MQNLRYLTQIKAAQFTSDAFTGTLKEAGVMISMDGRGRALDNIFVERLWRTVKYERVYLHNYETVREAIQDIGEYFDFYNNTRPHMSLDCQTPAEIYFDGFSQRKVLSQISFSCGTLICLLLFF